MDPQWEERGLSLWRVPKHCGEGQAQERKVTFREELKQWNSSALMSHKTSSKHGFSIWKHLHAESSALTVHERARSLRTRLPDTRKNKLAFNCRAPHSTRYTDQSSLRQRDKTTLEPRLLKTPQYIITSANTIRTVRLDVCVVFVVISLWNVVRQIYCKYVLGEPDHTWRTAIVVKFFRRQHVAETVKYNYEVVKVLSITKSWLCTKVTTHWIKIMSLLYLLYYYICIWPQFLFDLLGWRSWSDISDRVLGILDILGGKCYTKILK